MRSQCPACGSTSVVAQDIESLSDSVLLVKLEKRFQLCCQQCGWIAFADPAIQHFKEQVTEGASLDDVLRAGVLQQAENLLVGYLVNTQFENKFRFHQSYLGWPHKYFTRLITFFQP